MYCLNMDEEVSGNGKPINAERLLRSLGASGRLVGFRYTVSIVEQLLNAPYERHWLTKCIYPETGKSFNVSASSVERAVRSVIDTCWARGDHRTLDYVAGIHLERRPTNSEFLDMLVAFLKYKS